DLIGDQTPPYAIISHTWGPDDEEVTFQELITGASKQKIGYAKIQRCGEQALQDGLQYFWIDTCSIDKLSSAELSEAINSMFKWYQRANVCYVYLSDVTAEKNPSWILPSDEHLEEDEQARLENSSFAKSRWFTRGWTLQELLALKQIQFFDRNWTRLGNLKDLLAAVVHITKIDKNVLDMTQGWFLSDICIARRLSWAAKRQTTRIEDQAYCPMGIFNVRMPLLYGEGAHAFVRLQEEILKNTDNDSFLAWDVPSHIDRETDRRYERLLAPSPACFEGGNKLIKTVLADQDQPWSMSNLGLTITM
ncbi:HET-domain-containing protein, partial [Setomelanomma holmii]